MKKFIIFMILTIVSFIGCVKIDNQRYEDVFLKCLQNSSQNTNTKNWDDVVIECKNASHDISIIRN